MGTVSQRMRIVCAALLSFSARNALLWLISLTLIGGVTTIVLQSQDNDCMNWYEDNHAVLLRLIGENDSGCSASSNPAECSARARRALDELSKDRTKTDPFAISDRTCAAVREYRKTF